MPIKWYGNGDLEDPIYKHFSRIVNFVIHCMIFTAIVSGTWLLKEIKYEIAFFNNFAISWSILLACHLLFVFIKELKILQNNQLNLIYFLLTKCLKVNKFKVYKKKI